MVHNAVLVAGVVAAARIVEVGVIITERPELGASANNIIFGNSLPVLVSVPPIETSLRVWPSAATTIGSLKLPSASVETDGSSASCNKFPLRSIKTLAPESGPSITRPSIASVTDTVISCAVVLVPSDALNVRL